MMKKWTCFEIMYWFFPPYCLCSPPPICLSACHSIACSCEWSAHTHTRTHSSSTACCMVWAADISLQAICQSELDVLAWSHTNTPNHTYTNMPNLQWMNEGFFSPSLLDHTHACVWFMLRNASFPALTFCHLVIHVCNDSPGCFTLM